MARDREIFEPRECPACRANGRDGSRLTGTVKWFDQLKGFGFISREDGRGEVFVHRSDIKHVGVRVLYEGERVEFEVQRDPRGERAVHVTGHDPFAH
ncbi:MAG: cold shock domain-containing protein [Anaerolineae bacterium]|nr:cold shock domain-containing protein [Anaerolineae bacterium]NIN95834.1 cold shock domain-containing protein [Anaerolineae bacterium]NIQ78800.1 cold shock domain-containing protein [Anaerolineae bacterium]